jgi:predicted dehydrogenase
LVDKDEGGSAAALVWLYRPRVATVVVGTGFAGALHVDALRRLDIEVAAAFRSSGDFEAALADPAVNFVHLATPNHLHFQQNQGRKNSLSFQVDASAGSLAWNSERPDELWLGHRERADGVLPRERGFLPPGHVEGNADTFRHCFEAVYRGGEYPTFADGHAAMLVGDAIAESHRERRWVVVGS